ncbi:MAG: VCBS repeat-containing protein [Thermoplasmatales archaeon]|nr:MAG: VCBS repeat-containing protein [Thermoplasmatales archaeon]
MKKQIIPILIIGFLVLSGFEAFAFQIDDTKANEITYCLSNKNYAEQIPLDNITWTKHNVQNYINCAGIYSSDLDNDGDKDIIAASVMLDEISWWRNDGGKPIMWTKFIIGNNFDGAAYCYSIDLDKDGDNDVLGAAWYGNEIAWWRNDGGSPIVWTKEVISNSYYNAHEVYAFDLDGDGDNDVLGASAGLNETTWWRNDGGSPIHWYEQKIGDCFGARSVYVSDIDNDQNYDVLGADFSTNKILMWQNNGGNPIEWTKFTIDSSFAGAHDVKAYDVDKDGDSDVLGAAYISDDIAWWRNDGGNPTLWTKQKIDDSFNGALRVEVADIDNDGDCDILGTADLINSVSWWRNDGGSPIIWTENTIDAACSGAWPMYVVDIDEDEDVDVIVGGTTGISLYENNLYPISDLECEGSFNWIDVNIGDTITDSFTIGNVGTNGSLLDWDIIKKPIWGEWLFDPNGGDELEPGIILTISVTVIAPAEKNKEFTGEIKLQNKNNPDDYCTIDVYLSTPRTRTTSNAILLSLFEHFPNAFPMLRQILGFL